MNILGKKIKELRKQNNMTQSDMATKLHVTRQAVSKWENGTSLPDVEMLKSIATVLDINVSELIEEKTNSEASGSKKIYLRVSVIFVLLSFIDLIMVWLYEDRLREMAQIVIAPWPVVLLYGLKSLAILMMTVGILSVIKWKVNYPKVEGKKKLIYLIIRIAGMVLFVAYAGGYVIFAFSKYNIRVDDYFVRWAFSVISYTSDMTKLLISACIGISMFCEIMRYVDRIKKKTN